MKRKSKKSVQVSKQSQIVSTIKGQVPTNSVLQEKYVNQYVVQEVKEETSLWECQANVMNDKNFQVSEYAAKEASKEKKSSYMQLTKQSKTTIWLQENEICELWRRSS